MGVLANSRLEQFHCSDWLQAGQEARNIVSLFHECFGHIFFPLKRLGGRSKPLPITGASACLPQSQCGPRASRSPLAGLNFRLPHD